jgi:hypothetical protein
VWPVVVIIIINDNNNDNDDDNNNNNNNNNGSDCVNLYGGGWATRSSVVSLLCMTL